jgi:hypothetical protein
MGWIDFRVAGWGVDGWQISWDEVGVLWELPNCPACRREKCGGCEVTVTRGMSELYLSSPIVAVAHLRHRSGQLRDGGAALATST